MDAGFATRVRFILIGLLVGVIAVVIRLIDFQTDASTPQMRADAKSELTVDRDTDPPRGRILDRNGHVLAIDEKFYEIGLVIEDVDVDPPTDRIAPSELDLVIQELERLGYFDRSVQFRNVLGINSNLDTPNGLRDYVYSRSLEIEAEKLAPDYVPGFKLAQNIGNPIPAVFVDRLREAQEAELAAYYDAVAQEVPADLLPTLALQNLRWFESSWVRTYPEGSDMAHIVGVVNSDGNGIYGIEQNYDAFLKGEPQEAIFDYARPDEIRGELVTTKEGVDIHLTIDRDIQSLAMRKIAEGVSYYGAESGNIMVLDPQSGELIANAIWPPRDPLNLEDWEVRHFDTGVSKPFEPGSIFKPLTVAAAIESGEVNLDSTYYDVGCQEYHGVQICNWLKTSWGQQSIDGILRHSLNLGTTWLADSLGPTKFYGYLRAFRLDKPTNIDLAHENPGWLINPTSPNWVPSQLAQNSFGQGISTTPIQILSALSAIANGGDLMQPRVLMSMRSSTGEVVFGPSTAARPISQETADTVTRVLASAIEDEASEAKVDGYQIAGKTGTAQRILYETRVDPETGAETEVALGYDQILNVTSFVGWGPVDDPRFIVLVKLDGPTRDEWGGTTAAPLFANFVEDMVVLMELPPDSVRAQLTAD